MADFHVVPEPVLTSERLETILARIPTLRIAVIGDLFLDRYLDLDASLTEQSIETGLPAYQVVQVRPCPGAAGTVINNLVALGVGSVHPVAVIGEDGEGFELRRALDRLGVDGSHLLVRPDRRTPTYTKPMLQEPGQPARELNRLDIHNRNPLPADAEQAILELIDRLWPRVNGIVVLDQVSLADCGVVTKAVRERIGALAKADAGRPVLADSRERIGEFTGVILKPNRHEMLRAVGAESGDVASALASLSCRSGGPVFCTCGEEGIRLSVPGEETRHVPGYPVTGPIDPVGAGDSTSAGIICALASGASRVEAASFGNLVASITVQQIGTTGTANPQQVRHRFDEVSSRLRKS